MLLFIVKRLASGVVLIVMVSLIAFTLLYVGSGDIARRMLGATATAEAVDLKRQQLGLDRPVVVQYWNWLTGAIHGDLGRSWFGNEPIASILGGRIAVTLSLVIGTTLVSIVIATVLGVLAARRRGKVDSTVQVVSLVGFAVPSFLVALVFVLVFALELGWFRATGYVQPSTSLSGWLGSITLPIAALSAFSIAGLTQQVRSSVIDALNQDYVRTLRARGLKMNRIVYRHVLRNAGAPALAIVSVQFVGLLGGSVLVETIFALPGMGGLAVTSSNQGDIPVMMGLVVVFAIIVVIVNLLIELAQPALNPKVRLS